MSETGSVADRGTGIVGEDGRIDGARLAREERDRLRTALQAVVGQRGRPPGLTVILVGDDPASKVYVRMKQRAAEEIGFAAVTERLSATVSTAEVVAAVERWNHDPTCDGILVQMPLPPQVASEQVLAAVWPDKDVDGLTTASLGRLAAREPGSRPCTPRGVMALLARAGEPVAGRRVVIVGRSRLVGLPLALLMTHADATVTLCHSRTPDLAEHVAGADIVVAAAGRPHLIQAGWVRPDTVLIDVGTTRGPNGLLGDVDPAANHKARLWTPVPGGVGPMTVAMLLDNTWRAYSHG